MPIRGNAPAHPAVPADAVTASGSGLDPEISPAYADLQAAAWSRRPAASLSPRCCAVISKYKKGRDLGFLGQPRVNVLQLNLALDKAYPVQEVSGK